MTAFRMLCFWWWWWGWSLLVWERGCTAAQNASYADDEMSGEITPRPTAQSIVTTTTCPAPSVPYRAFSACVLADGLCVSSLTECDSLGGRYDETGCGDGRLYLKEDQKDVPASCACCSDLPTDHPTPRPTLTHSPTFPYPQGSCAVEKVPTAALKACLKEARGYCLSNKYDCDQLGGIFDSAGCDPEARCGCCMNIPTPPPVAAVEPPPPPKEEIWGPPRVGDDERDQPLISDERQFRTDEAKTRGAYSVVLRLAGVLILAVLAAALFPQPSNPILKLVLSPFALLFLAARSFLLFLASLCFSLGEGISEPRPPAPIGMKSMPLRDVQMSERRYLHRDNKNSASSDSLLANAELEDTFELETATDDEEDEQGDTENPFKKGT